MHVHLDGRLLDEEQLWRSDDSSARCEEARNTSRSRGDSKTVRSSAHDDRLTQPPPLDQRRPLDEPVATHAVRLVRSEQHGQEFRPRPIANDEKIECTTLKCRVSEVLNAARSHRSSPVRSDADRSDNRREHCRLNALDDRALLDKLMCLRGSAHASERERSRAKELCPTDAARASEALRDADARAPQMLVRAAAQRPNEERRCLQLGVAVATRLEQAPTRPGEVLRLAATHASPYRPTQMHTSRTGARSRAGSVRPLR